MLYYPVIFIDMEFHYDRTVDRELRVVCLPDMLHPDENKPKPTAPLSTMARATSWLGGGHHATGPGAGETEHIHHRRARLPDPDAFLSCYTLYECVQSLGISSWKDLSISWTVPPGLGQTVSAVEGREVLLKNDDDVNGFIRTFWPVGFHECAHTPILKAVFRPQNKAADVDVAATGGEASGGEADAHELPTVTGVSPEGGVESLESTFDAL
ncbi:unnamed protein product [Tilletia controversa]|uniref:Uncharacterized protein n=3 Tax=Tilletia TaxID=13289 RepID=A0A8X7ML64_9BASI|nr:hypothetical protein CF336_g8521 [Tilletia laevis]KAE8186462.1 hypothetical protein CF328_g7224 [Tilletia controversa]KAE8240660.1 hypothetical protein A4X03_0g8452 [Tilletia caries]KAE8206767.1 hypothetical protein CF335_g1637 [Tilletia laevis]KAE8239889.1 hypothetical protein A4X06_0g7992 [Tilletia controversa]